MNMRGFTITELIVVIAVIAILCSIAIPNYNSMLTRQYMEKQTRELHSDIISIRLKAMQTKQPAGIFFGPNSYTYNVYTSLNYPVSTGAITATRNYNYALQKISGGTQTNLNIATDKIVFDSRGLADNTMKLVVTPVTYNAGDNCIIVQTARTNIGRMENVSSCSAR